MSNVTIEDYVWIVSRTTILSGVTMGRGVVVACGTVVTRDVPPLAIVWYLLRLLDGEKII